MMINFAFSSRASLVAALFLSSTALSGCIAMGDTITTTAAQTAVAANPRAAEIAQAPAGGYALDGGHTSVVFRVDHMGTSKYTARFDKVSGSLNLNPAAPTQSSVDVHIDANSISTGMPAFNVEIANQALKAQTSPDIHFVSTSLTQTAPGEGLMTGNLTLAGQTHPVTLSVHFYGLRANPFAAGRKVVGFSATGSINRSEWGVNNWVPYVGDNVTIAIETEFLQNAQ